MKKNLLLIVFVITSLLLSPFAFYNKANAGTFSPAKLTISDSRASRAATQYDFAFTTTVTTSIKQLTILFCTTASGACTVPTGMTTTSAVRTTDNLAGRASGETDTFTSNGTLTTVITTPSAQATQAVTVTYTTITNPSTVNTSFFARITTYSDTGTTVIDTSTVAAAILNTTSIAVTASVDPTFTFTITPVTSGTVNGATINVAGTTAILVPFGTLSSGSTGIAAEDMAVTTNAANGYNITIKETTTPPLQDGTNNMDEFSGTNATPTVWSSPAGSSPSVNTGYFGYTTNSSTLCTGTAGRFSSNKWAGPTTSALEVACNSTGASGAQTTRLGLQAEVNALQPPGSYTGTVILVATPTY